MSRKRTTAIFVIGLIFISLFYHFNIFKNNSEILFFLILVLFINLKFINNTRENKMKKRFY
jgi:hypothetical protein